MALICIEAGKNLMAYNIFTKYLNNSSLRYIDYLIQNTDELAEYRRGNQLHVINLPVMTKKQPQPENKKKKKQNIQQY